MRRGEETRMVTKSGSVRWYERRCGIWRAATEEGKIREEKCACQYSPIHIMGRVDSAVGGHTRSTHDGTPVPRFLRHHQKHCQ